MEDEPKIPDNEFLDGIRERLKSTGQAVVIIDSGVMKFAKFASLLIGIFALIGLTLFGVNIEETAKNLREAKDKLEAANSLLAERNQELELLLQEARVKLDRLDKLEADAKLNADRNLEQTMSAFADFVRAAPDANVQDKEERGKWASVTRDYFNKNIAFATEIGLISVRISMLRRLAKLEREMDNTEAFETHFEAAIRLANAEGRFSLAGELQVEYATARVSSSPSSSVSVIVKSRRLLESAIANFDRAGDTTAKVTALLKLAEVHELDRSYKLALETLNAARKIYRNLEISEELLSIINQQARMLEQLGDTDGAMRQIRESISIAEDLDDFDFAWNKYVKLARMAENENQKIISLCLALGALKNVEGRESKLKRLLSRAERIAEGFRPSDDCKE